MTRGARDPRGPADFLTAPPEGGARALARGLLAPAAMAYAAGARLRAFLYRTGALRARRVSVPVISVGNLVVGGTGKTPFVLWLCRRLRELGITPGVVTRGYGARRGAAPRLVDPEDPLEGDEARLVAARLGDAPVVAGRDRVAGAHVAISHGAEAIVLDDGFQHLRLARDLDLLLVDARFPPPRARLLPAGPFREPWSAAARADLAVVVDGPADAAPGGLPVVLAARRPSGLTHGAHRRGRGRGELAELSGAAVFLVSGIARPELFRRSAEELGARVLGEASFPDHHRFRSRDLGAALDAARAAGARLIVTTEKDAVRMPAAFLDRDEVAVLEIELEIREGRDALDRAVRFAVGKRGGTVVAGTGEGSS